MTTAAKPRLTPHQAEVFGRLQRLSAHRPEGWVDVADIGSRGALSRLVGKGYIESRWQESRSATRKGMRNVVRPV